MNKTGDVLWFNNTKGWGFIICEGVEYFVHYSSIKQDGFKMLEKGQQVSFRPEKSEKGMQAYDVELI